ncbi:MAG: rhodanese-like domain-containing protein [Deltaproteobacteria bacterium]|nr:rhodanese-like domain-containing protein [Deltaproteobacteria bacterium]
MRTLFLASALAFVTTTAGCSKAKDTAEANVPTVSVAELDASLSKAAAIPVDANGERTRKKLGIIPGAVLLTDSDNWAISELPADKTKPLVFYCANTSCGASHEAAEKAMTAGYTNVKVLPDGIAGWVKAGKKAASI